QSARISKIQKMVTLPWVVMFNPLTLLSKNLAGYRLWAGRRRPSVNLLGSQPQSATLHGSSGCEPPPALQVWPASIQVESVPQHLKCVAHYLALGSCQAADRSWDRIASAFENAGVNRPIKEPRRDT